MRTVPLRRLYRRAKILGFIDEPMLSVYREHGVVLKDETLNHNKTAENRNIYQLVDKGWLVVNRMKAWQGALGVSTLRGIVSGHYICFEPVHHEYDRYLHYALRSPKMTAHFASISRGVRPGQIEIDNDDLASTRVSLPDLEEQRRIADFLDDQVDRIDRIVAARREQIRLSTERLAGQIDSLVSGGPSLGRNQLAIAGSDADGRPRISYVAALNSGRAITADLIEPVGTFPVFGANGPRGFTSKATHDGEYVLIGRQGALCGNAHLATGGFWASEHALVMTSLADYDVLWMLEVVRALRLRQYSESAAQPGISASVIGSLRIPWPTLAQQRRLGEECAKLRTATDRTINSLTGSINLLAEYKESLITTAVSGELDVTTVTSGVPA